MINILIFDVTLTIHAQSDLQTMKHGDSNNPINQIIDYGTT